MATISTRIPGISPEAEERLLNVFARQPGLRRVWLYGSRAMGRHRSGSDLDLTLEGDDLSHHKLLLLLQAIDDLLLPWSVDLSLRQELPADLEAHIERVGRCIWSREAEPGAP
ncbi:MAG: nucleotidyltransferase domain-containing protein [Synechococcus sp.]|nr:nucleotidyltransferase domain-containing protein [Synechococcus sp.]